MRLAHVKPTTRVAHYKAVVFGGSAGGVESLVEILSGLPPDFPMSVFGRSCGRKQ